MFNQAAGQQKVPKFETNLNQLEPDTHSKDDNQWNNLIFYIKEGKHIVPIDFLVNFEILYHNIKTGQMLAHKM